MAFLYLHRVRAWALLGHWRYAARRHVDAIEAWRTADRLNPTDPVVVRTSPSRR